MTQPLDRLCYLPALGDIDHSAGEFWVENSFQMKNSGKNLSAYERNRLFLNRNGSEFVDASFASNVELSNNRAAAVRDALVSQYGISADRLEAAGVGPLSPVSNNTGQAGRALNRRVEIVQRLE